AFRSAPATQGSLSRRDQLSRLLDYFGYATGAGLLSPRQLDSLRAAVSDLLRDSSIPAGRYLRSIRYLERSGGWCRATAGREFGPVSRHYQSVAPSAGGLVDHLLRGSIALSLSGRLETLVADASRAAGIQHSIFGEHSNRGVVALNPGVAIGRLGIIDNAGDGQTIDPTMIYV